MIGRWTRFRTLSGGFAVGLLATSLALAASGGESEVREFDPIMSEMRLAVSQTAEVRSAADRGGDKVKELCIYERLRGMLQAVSAAEVAQVAWEAARARNDMQAAQAELANGQKALLLVRQMRGEADQCVGKELARGPGVSSSMVTVETTVKDDDPNAGPVEAWVVRPPRLDLPGRAVPASPF